MQWLKKYYSEKFVHNKYNHLLIGIVILFLVAPLYLQTGLKFPLIMFLFFIIVQLALRAAVTDKKKLKYHTILTLTGLACTLISRFGPGSPKMAGSFYIAGRAIYVGFLVITIRIFVKKLFAARIVTSDRIKGSIWVIYSVNKEDIWVGADPSAVPSATLGTWLRAGYTGTRGER